MIEALLNVGSTVTALLAAFFWYKSATVQGIEKSQLISDDPFAKIASWSQRAAMCAGASALFQAVVAGTKAFQ